MSACERFKILRVREDGTKGRLTSRQTKNGSKSRYRFQPEAEIY